MFSTTKVNVKNEIVKFEKQFSDFNRSYGTCFMPFAGGANEDMLSDPAKKLEKLSEFDVLLNKLQVEQEKIIVMIIGEIKQSNDQDEKMERLKEGRYLVRIFNYPKEILKIKEMKLWTELEMGPKLTPEERKKAKEPLAAEWDKIVFKPKDSRLEELAESIEQQKQSINCKR